jgi:hypothetical protein
MDLHHHQRNNIVAGVLLLGLGLLLLIGQTFRLNIFDLFENWNIAYPLYIVTPGIVLMAIGVFGGRNLVGFTILGSIALVSGGVLAFQEATNSYQTWAYLWALVFPGSIGLAMTLQSFVTQDSQQRKSGLSMVAVALVLTLIGWSFFEGAVNLSGFGSNALANFAGPLLLIGLGVWLLLRRGLFGKEL